MAFIINKRGERVNVDMEVEWFSSSCALYADDAELQEYYLLNLYKGKHGQGYSDEDAPTLIKQIEFSEEPTKDRIMAEMWKHGLSRYDVATIEKGYRLDWNERN